jgi:hypothetical protein
VFVAHVKMIRTIHKVFFVSVHLVTRVIDAINVSHTNLFFISKHAFLFLVLNCLDSGEECMNGGQCVQRPLGDYVCSCPYPYCGLRCQSQRPSCGGIFC